MTEPRLILFVCTGNLCRSPMAAGLLRQRLMADGRDDAYKVSSAGTWAVEGQPAAANARQVMAQRGISIEEHRARNVTRALVSAASLILVMTEAHREAIVAEFPEARAKTYRLSELIGKHYDIADPYGASLAHYAYCAQDLEVLIDAGYQRILELAGGTPA